MARYHALLVGKPEVVKVRDGESEVQYAMRSTGNIDQLREYIRGLNEQCPCLEANAVLGIPSNRRPGQFLYGQGHVHSLGRGCLGCK